MEYRNALEWIVPHVTNESTSVKNNVGMWAPEIVQQTQVNF